MSDTTREQYSEHRVNMEILAAWDHKPGDRNPDWYRGRGTDEAAVLDEVNQPSDYGRLSKEERAALQDWIARELVPSATTGRFCSYQLKHIFDRLPGGFYTTNGAFKGAMIAAGYEPLDRTELNWTWHYVLADPLLWERSVGRRGCGRAA